MIVARVHGRNQRIHSPTYRDGRVGGIVYGIIPVGSKMVVELCRMMMVVVGGSREEGRGEVEIIMMDQIIIIT